MTPSPSARLPRPTGRPRVPNAGPAPCSVATRLHRPASQDRADHANHNSAHGHAAGNEISWMSKGGEGKSCAARACVARE